MELKDLKSFKKLVKLDYKLATQVESVYEITKETINSISGCYNNFTMHDMAHGLRVASYMEELAFGIDDEFEQRINCYNAFELSLLILSAILHDIGMFIRPEDKENIKNNIIPYATSLTFEGVLSVVDNDEEEAIKEIVRITHANRIKEFIDYDFNGNTISKILMLDDKYSYADDVVSICIAHGENYDYLRKLRSTSTKGSYSYNVQFIAAILRIADYLDLDKQRTPILWYKMMKIDGFSRDEWERHFLIQNEKKLKKYINDKLQIYFEGKSSNAKIHRKYLGYIDEIKEELERADELLNTKDTEDKYLFNISTKVDDNVITEGFKYSDLRLNLDYSSITNLLMGKNIYGDSKLGLRELIQNSIDACELMKEIQNRGEEVIVEPQIIILLSKQHNYVKIKDTGIGMTLEIVKKHFLNVGKSYYKSNEYLYENYDYKPIGQYGIGFLACFLLSDNVSVKTKYYSQNEINQIELERNSEYVVTSTEETGNFIGTEIVLEYDKFFEIFGSEKELMLFLEQYFYTSIPIKLKNVDSNSGYISVVNRCNDIILNKIEKEKNNKYDTIVCEKYSEKIEGKIKIWETQKKRKFNIMQLEKEDLCDTYYCYNNKTKIFDKIDNLQNLGTKYYYMLQYTKLDPEMYKNIVKTRKSEKTKRKEILSVGEKVILFIDSMEELSYGHLENYGFQFMINDCSFKIIIENSSLSYYKELVEDFEYFENVFCFNGMYVNLQACTFDGLVYDLEKLDGEALDFYFYNKGIWIKRFGMQHCFIPYALLVRGVVNYNGEGIKLDVSRNSIISDRKIISKELSKIILSFMKEKNDNRDWINMLDKMIEYNEQ